MSKTYVLYLISIVLLLLTQYEIFSQDIKLDVSKAEVQQILPSQLDFQNIPNNIWLFTIIIEVNNPQIREVKFVNSTITARLRGGREIKILEGEGFSSEPFSVVQGKNIITNLDFGNSIIIRNFKISSEARQQIIDIALASGRFPMGEYIFDIKVIDATNSEVYSEKEIKFNFDAPLHIDLLTPRDGELTNEFPLFEWIYDGDEVELIINEKVAGATREEAISRFPFVFRMALSSSQNSFLYPASGVRKLEKGRVYVWRVIGKTREAGGVGEQLSPIWEFSIFDDTSPEQKPDLLDLLEESLGSRWKKVFDEVRKNKFKADDIFYLNNKPITRSEFDEILNFVRKNLDNVISVTID